MARAGRSIKNSQGVSCLAEKVYIKGTIDNKGQNENFFNGESKTKLKIERSHYIGLVQSCASFRFQVVSLPGCHAAKKTLKKIKILATSVYKFSLSAMMNLRKSDQQLSWNL